MSYDHAGYSDNDNDPGEDQEAIQRLYNEVIAKVTRGVHEVFLGVTGHTPVGSFDFEARIKDLEARIIGAMSSTPRALSAKLDNYYVDTDRKLDSLLRRVQVLELAAGKKILAKTIDKALRSR